MTKEDFKQLLIRNNPGIKVAIEVGGMDLPRAALDTCAMMFLNGVVDTDDAVKLRTIFNRLVEKGYFEFD